jgi:hypothetical protein
MYEITICGEPELIQDLSFVIPSPPPLRPGEAADCDFIRCDLRFQIWN